MDFKKFIDYTFNSYLKHSQQEVLFLVKVAYQIQQEIAKDRQFNFWPKSV